MRCGALMVRVLYSVPSSLGSSTDRGQCVVSLGKALTLTVPLLHPGVLELATKCWGVTCDGLASHPGEVIILPVGFMLWKLEYM